MTSRRMFFSLLLTLVVASVALVGCGRDQNSTVTAPESGRIADNDQLQTQASAADVQWWRNLSQADRNMIILQRAYRDNGQYVGLNCKMWAQKVVSDASRGVVTLPQTLPTAEGWYYTYSPYLVGMSGGIRSVQPGTIIQMRYKWASGTITVHTMFVTWRSSTAFGVIESNVPAGSLTVGTRNNAALSFSDFERNVQQYSCYYVIGG